MSYDTHHSYSKDQLSKILSICRIQQSVSILCNALAQEQSNFFVSHEEVVSSIKSVEKELWTLSQLLANIKEQLLYK